MTKDSLGDRMKANYENVTRYMLPRRTYMIIRVDGRAFHTFTKGCVRPFDLDLMGAMDGTAKELCQEIEGAQFAYVQSDEISILITDFENTQTQGWFSNNLSKIVSVSASVATGAFNQLYAENEIAHFDSRAFTIPDRTEVINYFVWRQQDATRNSISMLAQANFPHKELQGKSSNEMQEMLFQQKGINWNDQPIGFKRGRMVIKATDISDVTYTNKKTGSKEVVTNVQRNFWKVIDPPVFCVGGEIERYVPRYGD